jgi:hypothetical protein
VLSHGCRGLPGGSNNINYSVINIIITRNEGVVFFVVVFFFFFFLLRLTQPQPFHLWSSLLRIRGIVEAVKPNQEYRLPSQCKEFFFFFFFYGATARYRALASLIKPFHSRLNSRVRDTKILTVRGRQPLAQPRTWRNKVSHLVWIIPFDLSGTGGPTSSYATAGIALRVS